MHGWKHGQGLFPGYVLLFASSAFLFESGKVGVLRLGLGREAHFYLTPPKSRSASVL